MTKSHDFAWHQTTVKCVATPFDIRCVDLCQNSAMLRIVFFQNRPTIYCKVTCSYTRSNANRQTPWSTDILVRNNTPVQYNIVRYFFASPFWSAAGSEATPRTKIYYWIWVKPCSTRSSNLLTSSRTSNPFHVERPTKWPLLFGAYLCLNSWSMFNDVNK